MGSRYLALAVSAACLLAVAAFAWSRMTGDPGTAVDPLLEPADAFEAPPVTLGEATSAGDFGLPLQIPPAAGDAAPLPRLPGIEEPRDTQTAAHFTAPSDAWPPPTSQAPVWLEGTIEPIDGPPVTPVPVRQAYGYEPFRR